MKFRCIKIMKGEYRFVINNDLYFIQRQKIDYKVSWIAENAHNSKPAFKANIKKALITLILQHHAKKS